MSDPSDRLDPVNPKIFAVSEDLLEGLQSSHFDAMVEKAGVGVDMVLERFAGMLDVGALRRVRETLLSMKLAEGALVAWKFAEDRLNHAFEFMAQEDPFSGQVVIRSTDEKISGSSYCLWTTLKVPCGKSLTEHLGLLQRLLGAEQYILMPAKGVFTLEVDNMRRLDLPPGARLEQPAQMMTTTNATLRDFEREVLALLKKQLGSSQIKNDIWVQRAAAMGMEYEEFETIRKWLEEEGELGVLPTYQEHRKSVQASGESVNGLNALFHWAVPPGFEERAGGEVGRHHCIRHACWQEAGAELGNVNIMGVIHGTEKEILLEHKAAIDKHLGECQIPVIYTAVFWGGRSKIKPPEISPTIYTHWHEKWESIASASMADVLYPTI